MMSMTGFGRAELTTRAGRFSVEVSTVNNRFLEISVRLPRQFFALEQPLRDLVQANISRGKVHLYVSFDMPDGSPGKYPLNVEAAKSYHKQLMSLRKQLKLEGGIAIRDLLLLPEVSSSEGVSIDDKAAWPPLERAAKRALDGVVRMRRREGTALARDMGQRTGLLIRTTKKISRLAEASGQERKDRLKARIDELLDRPLGDEGRLEEELAILADKADITEECTRLLSHTEQAKRNLKRPGPTGKKLNFILQEMNREANTIASKSASIEITRLAISLKEEIEKLREQVQNVE